MEQGTLNEPSPPDAAKKNVSVLSFLLGAVCSVTLLISVSSMTTLWTTAEARFALPKFQTFEVSEGPLSGSRIVRYVGSISPQGADALIAYSKNLPTDRKTWLALQSGGGDVKSASSIASYINSVGIGALIPGNAQCASACVIVFSESNERFAFPKSYFGFHYETHEGPLFNFYFIKGNYKIETSMSGVLVPLVAKVPARKKGLSEFFEECTQGNPINRQQVVYLTWEQIQKIVTSTNLFRCDEVAGHDSAWLEDQISPLIPPSQSVGAGEVK
jgi:hypothetical protein